MITKDQAYKKIAALVERFEEQKEFYIQASYNETLTRRDFIDPFFKALGWDIDNEQGYAESYREVIHEDKIKIGGATKAPDYSFRLGGGKRLFFVEAKKPSVLIKSEITPAYQVRRYGWSAKLPISIITDFEEFAIYDCTKKPSINDKASNGRIKYLTYQQYLNEFDFIWDTFSKEKVLKGSFDKFIQSDKQKKGTATVDYEFLNSLDTWRTYLANNIALRNNIDEDELNFVVQHIIDRIIFLRIAEDRSVEKYGNLQDTIKSGNFYENLLKQFHTADQKYNSGLFDFSKDKVSGNIEIDNKIMKSIITDLYYPICPYEFSVISVEILGSAYEQFLGKTISLSKTGRAVIEEKPEVRKAGGVYYTPAYIVEYIVKKTVGELVANKPPREINKIKIVDPACGSGSFLIGAYQYLLQYHKDYYTNNGKPSKGSKNSPLTPEGNLTTDEKKRILLNNIFGVDLDANAVEVTKLSLLLKCMEGETEASIATQLKLFHERILPTLDNNIKNGNSLIDIEFYSSEIDFGEEKKIKPFSWKRAFPEVFKQGGFDSVIGNPPFVQLSSEANTTSEMKSYLISTFKSSMGRLNTYGFFTKKAIDLIKEHGYVGYIIPNTITTQDYYEELREMILNETSIKNIVNFDKLPFKDAVVENVVLILEKNKTEKIRKANKIDIVQCDERGIFNFLKTINQETFNSTPKKSFNISLNPIQEGLVKKILGNNNKLGSFLQVNQAIALKSDRSKWVFEVKKNSNYKPLLVGGKNINRYSTSWDGSYLNYDLNGIHSCKREDIFLTEEKILFRRVSSKLIATLDKSQYYALHTIVVMNLKETTTLNLRYFLALFNSNLLDYYYKKVFASTKKVFSEVGARQVEELPIVSINNNNRKNQAFYAELIKLVDQLLNLNEEKTDSKSQSKIDQIKNRIDYCEQRINEIVYQLYGLTDDEIRIIEEKA